MNSVAVDIKDMLEAESGSGFVFGTNLFIGQEPDKPNECTTIFDTPGMPPQLSLSRESYRYESIQVRVRSNTYPGGWEIVNRVMALLHGRAGEEWNDAYYSIIYVSSGPALLDWDNNQRVRFIINFEIQRR